MRIDTGWFNDQIKKSPYGSQRRIARKIKGRQGKPLDPSSISLMLRGKRGMTMDEARQFADLLDVPLIEILKHAGVALPDEGNRTYPLIGYIDRDAEIHMFTKNESVAGPNLERVLHRDQKLIFHRPIKVGDRLWFDSYLDSVIESHGTVISEIRAEVTDDDGQPVMTSIVTMLGEAQHEGEASEVSAQIAAARDAAIAKMVAAQKG